MARESPQQVLLLEAADPFDPDLRRTILAKARRLVTKSGMSPSDVPDVEQTLLAALLQAAGKLDGNRGSWQALAHKSLKYSATKLLRDSFAKKRAQWPLSLNVLIRLNDEEGSVELAQLITRVDGERRRSLRSRDDGEAAQLVTDIDDFISSLPQELRELARSLRSTSISEIARRSRTSRSTIYERLAQLRKAAEASGLADYLK